MAKKLYDEENIKLIANKIRLVTGQHSKKFTVARMPNAIQDVYDSGYEQGELIGSNNGYADGLVDGAEKVKKDEGKTSDAIRFSVDETSVGVSIPSGYYASAIERVLDAESGELDPIIDKAYGEGKNAGYQAGYEAGGGGFKLPTLTNPGTAKDLVSNKQLIDGEGNIVTGTVPTRTLSDVNDDELSELVIPSGFYKSTVYYNTGKIYEWGWDNGYDEGYNDGYGEGYSDGSDMGGDVELPILTNPGAAADLLKGKQLIDGNGNIITGTIPTRTINDITFNNGISTCPAGYYANEFRFDSSSDYQTGYDTGYDEGWNDGQNELEWDLKPLFAQAQMKEIVVFSTEQATEFKQQYAYDKDNFDNYLPGFGGMYIDDMIQIEESSASSNPFSIVVNNQYSNCWLTVFVIFRHSGIGVDIHRAISVEPWGTNSVEVSVDGVAGLWSYEILGVRFTKNELSI